MNFSVGDGVVYPLREDTSPERLDLLNERSKWMEDADSDEDDDRHDESRNNTAAYTSVETIDETNSEHAEGAIVRTPDVVTFN